ncbi:MAG: O-antigen ligase family protein [Marinosulfonomonas sp.]
MTKNDKGKNSDPETELPFKSFRRKSPSTSGGGSTADENQLFVFSKDHAAPSPKFLSQTLTSAGNGGLSRGMNSALTIGLLSVVALSPIPAGSNRPVFWMMWAAFIFAVFGIYLLTVSFRRQNLRTSVSQIPLLAASALGFVGFAVFQSLPVQFLFPFDLAVGPNAVELDTVSLSRDATRVAALRWASYAVFFFLMLQVVDNRARARRLGWIIFAIVAAHSAFALVSFRYFGDAFFWGPKNAYSGVVTGTFINRNSFATFAGFGAILGYALLLHDFARGGERPRRFSMVISVAAIKSLTLWLFLTIILAALVASGSRMGLAATLAGLTVTTFLTIRRHASFSRRSILGLVAVIVATSAFVLVLFGGTVVERAIFTAPASITRLDIYGQVFELIQARPLLGYGLDAFELAFEQVHRPPVSPELIWDRAHSTYLSHWAEMGVVFGSLPILICLAIVWKFAATVRTKQRDYVLAVAGLGVMTLAAVHSLVDFSLEMSANVYLFLAILALGLTFRDAPKSSEPPLNRLA